MGLHVLHLHLHGLFRGHHLELGRDADTGGQTTYVLELARSMAARPEVERVEVVTRLIDDRRVSHDYAAAEEILPEGALIRRFAFGPRRYLRKELLWPHLDELADRLCEHLLSQPRLPDWIHAHYADAGYVGALLKRRLGIPLVFTGHSLGREKRRRLVASGLDPRQIDQQYAMDRRIEAEELALTNADLVVTSTRQELEQQYARYLAFQSERARVIPPGVDMRAFRPPLPGDDGAAVEALLAPFLREPERLPLLAICRPDRRKNIPALVEVFGRSRHLRQQANLVLVLGCRHDPEQLDRSQRDVLQQIFELVDRFDLYGQVAYPKHHQRDQVPDIYRWAARRGGLFVNPALTEPFGLTLLEAAASGLPVVATDDGGPQDILRRCDNGALVDVSDLDALQRTLETALADRRRWQRWADNGVEAASRHFSWDAHVCSYLGEAGEVTRRSEPRHRWPWLQRDAALPATPRGDSPSRLLVLDLDASLSSPDHASLAELRRRLQSDADLAVAVCTGRGFRSARHRFDELQLPPPGLWITGTGTEIHYGSEPPFQGDEHWQRHIGRHWDRPAVQAAIAELGSRLQPQGAADQGPFKVSYLLREPDPSLLPMVRQTLRQHGLLARAHLFQHWYLDVLPLTASKAEAIRYVALRWNLPLTSVLVGASQQGDGELLGGLPLAVVPDDHDPTMETLRGQRRVYFAPRPQAWGLIDGLEHHRFLQRP
ncbi:MAG: HAD family hydrolase [Cyanobacteriota bacterium]|nr:HAD family hydrolase [Cyanobacteriota bacterium]